MLILSRKLDESIIIGDDISVKILSIDKGVVKIGIEAPKYIPVLREELKEAVSQHNRKASLQIDESLLSEFYKKFKT